MSELNAGSTQSAFLPLGLPEGSDSCLFDILMSSVTLRFKMCRLTFIPVSLIPALQEMLANEPGMPLKGAQLLKFCYIQLITKVTFLFLVGRFLKHFMYSHTVFKQEVRYLLQTSALVVPEKPSFCLFLAVWQWQT